MDLETIRRYCLEKAGTTEDFPFDEDTLVFRVMGKMFLLTSVSNPEFVNLKCDPERAIEYRERYEAVQPGYHMSKKLWNSVYLNAGVPDPLFFGMIDQSYELVAQSLKKAEREKLKRITSKPLKKK
ncbi:MAG: MmcQ/YjbR family DNA-binding protein [Bacteroidetes bacterium]|nr:MmcQ/YjbR family DNA-binding protein [Bacteroidota bacterium]